MEIRELLDLAKHRAALVTFVSAAPAIVTSPPGESAAAPTPASPPEPLAVAPPSPEGVPAGPGPAPDPASATTGGPLDESKLGDIATKLAGGFALIAALLAFFGVKDGQLDRILRNDGPPALFVFSLIGLAVVLGILAPIVRDGSRIRIPVVLFCVFAGPVLAVPVLPDMGTGWASGGARTMVVIAAVLVIVLIAFGTTFSHRSKAVLLAAVGGGALLVRSYISARSIASGDAQTWVIEIVLLVALVVATYFTVLSSMSLKLGAVLVGAALFATGTYGATKLAVDSKSIKDRPFLTAVVGGKDAAPVITVHVKADGLRSDEHVAVAVRGYATGSLVEDRLANCGPGCLLLQGFRSGGDTSGLMDATFDVPLPPATYRHISALAFVCGEQSDRRRDDCAQRVGKIAYADIRLPASYFTPSVSVTWPSADAARAEASIHVQASDLLRSAVVEMMVVARNGASHVLARASWPASTTGSVDQTVSVFFPRSDTHMCVLVGTRLPASPTCTPAADYTVVSLPIPPPPPK